MDEAKVREHAEAHARAMAAGDLATASRDLTSEGRATAGPVMAQMPSPLEAAEVSTVTDRVALIEYSGGGKKLSVESTWEDRDGRPMIVDLKVV
jgi:hypothetical protein